jgi:hypothetical protein
MQKDEWTKKQKLAEDRIMVLAYNSDTMLNYHLFTYISWVLVTLNQNLYIMLFS